MDDIIIIKNADESTLKSLEVDNWPIWEKEASEFDWHYDEEEICYLLEGRVEVTAHGDVYRFEKGDLVTFVKGLSCHWHILSDVKKRYTFR